MERSKHAIRTLNACGKYVLAGAAALAMLASFDTAHARFRVLHTFGAGNDGAFPYAGLIKDSAGNLYGTTEEGGGAGCKKYGCGTVFKLAPDGTETVLHAFAGGNDGALPDAGLIKDSAGNLYGTTYEGGGTGCGGSGCGIVFEFAADGTETVLYAFAGGNDGAFPGGGLIKDSAGDLFGTTAWGGSISCNNGSGCGTVFKLAPDATETVLHSFTDGSEGGYPYAGLIKDFAGNLYGTASGGGTSCDVNAAGCGTVFKLTPGGNLKVLHAFSGNDGANPFAGLIRDSAGNLYGTTSDGGGTDCAHGSGCGTAFELTADGTETVLHAFRGGTGGHFPEAGLIKDSAGNVYGTTPNGGSTSCSCGVVFKLGK